MKKKTVCVRERLKKKKLECSQLKKKKELKTFWFSFSLHINTIEKKKKKKKKKGAYCETGYFSSLCVFAACMGVGTWALSEVTHICSLPWMMKDIKGQRLSKQYTKSEDIHHLSSGKARFLL